MENTFLHFLNISITAGWIVLAVVILRLLLKKAPKWISCLLWAVVGLRLILPFSIESIFSLIPSTNTVDPSIVYQAQPTVNTGIDAVNSVVNPIISSSFAPNLGDSANPLQIWTFIAAWVWVIGIGIMLLYTLISYIILKAKVGTAVKLENNIYQSEKIVSPFILGVIKPKIYLPFKISDEDISHVVVHEQAHLRRRDHLIKPIAFVLLSVYWFNPLMWVAYILLCRDIELACDEKVIRDMEHTEKQEYSKALLDLSVRRISVAACPLAFGEVGVKARIKSVMNYKKPAFWIIIVALIVCIVVSVCFLTDPINGNNSYGTAAELSDLSDPDRFENVNRIRLISTSNDVTVVVEDEVAYIKEKISQLIISDKETSQSRAEDRPSDYCIMIYYDINNYVTLNFNVGCREVWYNNFVKPSFSYKVENPEVAKEIFKHSYTDPAVIQYDTVEAAILEHNENAYLKGDIGVCTYRELLTEGSDGKMKVYIQTLYGEYEQDDDTGEVKMVSGGASPVRLTFERQNGVYTCTEYYSKEKGYEKDFPEAALTALDSVDMDEMWAELDNKASQQLTSVIYYYSDGESALKSASLVLWGKENFQFSYSYLSSNLCMGKYTREGNKLVLREDDSDKVYTFIINDRELGKLVFDAENSSELPKYKYDTNAQPEVCLPDGAIFKTSVDITAGYDAILDVEVVDGVLYTLQVNSKLVIENKVNTCGSVILISLIETLSDDVVNKKAEDSFLSTPINKAILDIDYPYTETGRDGTTVSAYEYHLKDVPAGTTVHVTITEELKQRLGLESDVIEITTVENQVNTESDIYTEDEILSAVAVIEKDFEAGWQGCVLNEIYYAGDEKSKEYQDWADRNDADEALVLLSSFYVDESCPIGSLNKGDIYSDWMWILVRSKGGEWQHVDHGY